MNCGFLTTIKWGRRDGKQRYKCQNCSVLFTGYNPKVKASNELVWFRKWVFDRLTYRYLITDSGYSKATLERKFKGYLTHPPKFQIQRREKAHLIIDGTYFSNNLCLILYQDNDIKYTQLYRFSSGEHYKEIAEDLENLKILGVEIESITCDGHRPTLKAIKKVYPAIVLQRCIVHVFRMVHIWLRERPKTQVSTELKKIISMLPLVKTHNDRLAFTNTFYQWYKINHSFVNEKAFNDQTGMWWYRHKNLRRSSNVIQNAIPNLFHYLDNEAIPKSTNALESYFGHLKDSLSIHRGLTYENRKRFILWYLHFKNQSRNKGFLSE